jgi:hypothetical protein
LSERAIHIGVLVGALALAGWLFGIQGRDAHSPARSVGADAAASPLSIIPPGSAFVLSADIAQLRHAALGASLAARFAQLGPSTGDLSSLCGFDPLSALDQLALAVPSAGAPGSEHTDDFGVVATGRFSAAQIARCARASITARGGDPVDSQLGTFSSVRDRKTSGGEVAARDGGPLIVSGGDYFRALLDAAEGNAARVEHEDARDAHHAELRRALGRGTIVATWLLAAGWFERVSGDTGARLSPLRSLKALGARVDVSADVRVSVLLDCADAASVTEIEALLEQLRSSLSALSLDPALRGVGQRMTTSHAGPRLRLELTLTESELQALLDATLGPSRAAAPPAAPVSSSDILQIPAH